MKISVIGCGYLGLTHAASMASLGHEVVGVEVDPVRLNALQAGTCPYHEPGLPELMRDNWERLTFTDDYSKVSDAVVHFIGVGTPQDKQSNKADLSYVWSAAQSLREVINPRLDQVAVVGKSTVPPGTAASVAAILSGCQNTEVIWNPEFLREGHGIEDTLHPDRIVYGTATGEQTPGSDLVSQVYAAMLAEDTPQIITNYPTAELIKMAANSFLATKISFANAWAHLCDQVGGDIRVLTKAIGMDARIGQAFLRAGSGFGGGCLPKDLHSTMSLFRGRDLPIESQFFESVDAINEASRETVVKLIARLVEVPISTAEIPMVTAETLANTPAGINPPRVAILGAAFKANSDDVRLSPALAIATGLLDLGISVVITDPVALPGVHKIEPRAELSPSVERAIAEADLVVVGTEWPAYLELDPKQLPGPPRIIVDARNCLDPEVWRGAGWDYYGVGHR